MFARSTTFMARPESIDAGIAYVRDEVMPALQAMDGCIGVSMLCDRDSGRCIATSAWDSEDTMSASNEKAGPYRARGADIFGATPTVTSWEVAVLHREHRTADGSCARCTWISGPAEAMDRAVDLYRMAVLPGLEAMPGFCSASFFVDRATGRAVSCAVFDDRSAMEASRDSAQALRTRVSAELGATVDDVGEFELSLAHLRVPETA